MRKLIALILAVCTLLSFAVVASADATFTNSTTLTTQVPSASYVMNIPADQTVEFGKTSVDIGTVTITEAKGFALKKNVEVTVDYTDFTSKGVDTTIPYKLSAVNTGGSTSKIANGGVLRFEGSLDGTVKEIASYVDGTAQTVSKIRMDILSSDWGKALAGAYTSTITFTSAVVVQK